MNHSDFAELKELDQYAQPDNRPNQNSFMKYFVYSRGVTLFQGLKSDFERWKVRDGAVHFKAGSGPTIEKFLDDSAFANAKLDWVESEHNRLACFRRDLKAYYGLSDHPRGDMLFDLAIDFSQEQRANTVDELEDIAAKFEKLSKLIAKFQTP